MPTTRRRHPLEDLRWRHPAELKANDYNPNKVFPPELELLKISLLADGWTQPIVCDPRLDIVDGYHRWVLACSDLDVQADLAEGCVPVVQISAHDAAHRRMATVRHNRARGQHGVLRMGDIVRACLEQIPDPAEVARLMGMDQEELERLAETRTSPELVGKDSFGRGWVPTGR